MALYEHIFLARQDVSTQQVEALCDQFRNVITENGGTVAKTESWGLRSLAFRVRKNRKAHYTLFNLDASPEAIAEMERQMRLNEDVIRFMTIRVDEHNEGQSAILTRRERDDRPGRGGPRGDRGPRPDRGDRESRDSGPKPTETAAAGDQA